MWREQPIHSAPVYSGLTGQSHVLWVSPDGSLASLPTILTYNLWYLPSWYSNPLLVGIPPPCVLAAGSASGDLSVKQKNQEKTGEAAALMHGTRCQGMKILGMLFYL